MLAELHIEQGKVLEQTQHQLGIVHNIAAPTRFKIHIKGVADHSGATPMGMRRDALVSAAKLILAVNEAAETEKANGSVGTVGVVDVEPVRLTLYREQLRCGLMYVVLIKPALRACCKASASRPKTSLSAAASACRLKC